MVYNKLWIGYHNQYMDFDIVLFYIDSFVKVIQNISHLTPYLFGKLIENSTPVSQQIVSRLTAIIFYNVQGFTR